MHFDAEREEQVHRQFGECLECPMRVDKSFSRRPDDSSESF